MASTSASPRRKLWSLVFVVGLAAAALAYVLVRGWSPQLGLDLQGGASVVFQAEGASDEQLDDAIEIIRSRVDALGVAEPEIVRQGDSIVVNLPGVEDQQRALEVIGATAELRFRPVLQVGTFVSAEDLATTSTTTSSTATTAPGDTTSTTPTTAAGDTTTTTAAALGADEAIQLAALPAQETTTTTVPADTTTTTPTTVPGETTTTTATTPTPPTVPPDSDYCVPVGPITTTEADTTDATVTLPQKEPRGDDEGAPRECYQLAPVPGDPSGRLLVGSIVSDPQKQLFQGQWQVTLSIKGEDLELFNQVAAECYNRQQTCPTGKLAIVLDGVVQSAPSINVPAFDTGLSISGSFTESEAEDLKTVLRFGALPIELEAQTVQQVSPTLGKDSLRAGLVAGFIGVGLVAIYMLFYYRALGVVVLMGLTVWSALNFAVIVWLGQTQGLALSLAGVTGIIVSVGVTVDSYVVYFERLKDEIRSGKTIRSSVDKGFERAFRTILAADVASLIGAALLYWLTVGPVRGFAFFLGLSTVLDVFVAWFFTRPVVALLARREFFTRSRMFGVARGTRARPTEAVA